MSGNLLIGCGTLAVCVAIQSFVVSVLLRVLRGLENKALLRPSVFRAAGLLICATLIMFAGNLVQIAAWTRLFLFLGEFEDFATAFYHSAVNFSSLGYGDIVMSDERRLLGALEAANGVLMFGLTTSVLYALVSAIMRRTWNARKEDPDSQPGSENSQG
jgi:hypothetical protein